MFIPLPTKILGLDLSNYCLKAVEINHAKSIKTIQAINSLNVPNGLIEEGVIKNENKLAALIKKLINESKLKFKSKYAVISLPEDKTFIKVIDINIDEDQNGTNNNLAIEKTIKHELPRHMPINIEEMQIDWQVVESKGDNKKVIVAAVPAETVNSLLQVANKAGLKIMALEVEAQAITRCLIKNDKLQAGYFKLGWGQSFSDSKNDLKRKDKKAKQAQLIVDLGASKTNIILIDNELIQFSQNLNEINGLKLSEQIAQRKKISLKDAEKLKLIYGKSKKIDKELEEIIDDFIDKLSAAIIQALEFYQEHFNKEAQNAQIILCGGGAKLNKIDEKINRRLKKTVTIGNPLININQQLPKKINNILSYTTAIGLALRDNFEF